MKKSALMILLLLSVSGATAQTPITLQASIDTALKNNLQVKQEKLVSEYKKMLIGSAAVVPQTTLSTEVGQFNSIYNDTRFGLSQSFNFPKVYSTQKTFLTEEWKNNVLFVAVKEAELKRDVTTAFYHLLYLQQKAQLLQEADSLYSAFYRLTELRLQKGESNVLEKATAETQLGQIRLQRQQLQKDQAQVQLQFQLLLNSTTAFEVTAKEMKHPVLLAPVELSNHPTITFIKQQQQIAAAAIAVEKAKLLPDLSLGLFSTSIRGTGADDKYYPSTYRFQSMQIGVGIPVFAKAQKAKINSAKFSKQLAANQYALSMNELNTQYQSAQQQYLKYKETVDYFEKTGLQNATLIVTTANKQFNSGLINYLEWFMLINQATGIRNDYLEAVKNLNENSIHLNYYSNQ